MSDPQTRYRALHEAIEDHHRLLEIQNSLAGRFADGSCPAFNTWIVHVREELGKMTDLLDCHFRREEEDRLHDEIGAALPNATRRIEKLLAEHRGILERARSLCALAQATIQPGSDGPLRSETSDFFALLDAHERAERDLFLQAIEGEGGSPD
jgi:hypothetical protein